MRLYDSKIWVVNGEMLKILTDFHHRAEQRITGITKNRGEEREWEYTAVDEAMDAAGLHLIEVYIKRRQNTIAERGYCHPIYALCTEAEQMSGTIRMVIWWDQEAVNELEEYTGKRYN